MEVIVMAISKQEKRLCHLPNPMHLEACKKGGKIHRSKKTYTRKGKKRFDYRKEDFGSRYFLYDLENIEF